MTLAEHELVSQILQTKAEIDAYIEKNVKN
jgi:hypothetical protein